VIWVLPALVLILIGLALGSAGAPGEVTIVFAALAAILLVVTLLAAVVRPPWYMGLLRRFGVFRSARPNDMVTVGLGRTFQNIRLFHNMTALENVQVGMHSRLKANWWDAMFSTPTDRNEEKASAEKAREYLALVGLKTREDELAKNLPYGDQRRLEVARALASEPVLLLLDEPTAGMNPRETQSMMALINRLRTDMGLTVLLIEHDMRVVMGISDRVTVLDHGEKIAEGSPDDVRRDENVIRAYLGEPA
jgi:branched-chain amino acid transport system ATP-binding protein